MLETDLNLSTNLNHPILRACSQVRHMTAFNVLYAYIFIIIFLKCHNFSNSFILCPNMIMGLLSKEQKEQFVVDGYVIVHNAVPTALLDAGLRRIDDALARKAGLETENKDQNGENSGNRGADANGNEPMFYKVRKAPAVTDLYFSTVLHKIVAALLNGPTQIRDDAAQVACTAPDEKRRAEGFCINDPHPPNRWHVDASHGRFAPVAADFLILVGVALSPGQDVDENRGQLTVFPGEVSTVLPVRARFNWGKYVDKLTIDLFRVTQGHTSKHTTNCERLFYQL